MTNFELYDFQQTAVDETISELAFGSDNVAIDAPTASGKSFKSRLSRFNILNN